MVLWRVEAHGRADELAVAGPSVDLGPQAPPTFLVPPSVHSQADVQQKAAVQAKMLVRMGMATTQRTSEGYALWQHSPRPTARASSPTGDSPNQTAIDDCGWGWR